MKIVSLTDPITGKAKYVNMERVSYFEEYNTVDGTEDMEGCTALYFAEDEIVWVKESPGEICKSERIHNRDGSSYIEDRLRVIDERIDDFSGFTEEKEKMIKEKNRLLNLLFDLR